MKSHLSKELFFSNNQKPSFFFCDGHCIYDRKYLRKTKDKIDFMTQRDIGVWRQVATQKSLIKDVSRSSLEAFLYLMENKY